MRACAHNLYFNTAPRRMVLLGRIRCVIEGRLFW